MEKRALFCLALILFSTGVFFVSNHCLRGSLRSEIYLAKEIKTPLDSIAQYKIASEAPFKYRLLFPQIIKGTFYTFYDEQDTLGFYRTYRAWSLCFYITSVLAMFWLLTTCGFNNIFSFFGALLFVLLPPMLMAFSLPVHTREDTLGYILFFSGIVFMLKKKNTLFVLIACLGVLCRETLLLLPLLYFFYGDNTWVNRFVMAAVPGILWLSLRLIMGHDEYDVWLGLKWNLDNPEQVIGFLFITFNVCWLPFLFNIIGFRKGNSVNDANRKFFFRTAWFSLLVILVTTFVGGIYNEIRLLYLFSPWIIIITLDYIERNRTSIYNMLQNKKYWMYGGVCFIISGILMYFVLRYQDMLIVPGKYAVPYDLWIILSVCYIFILLLSLPFFIQHLSLKKSIK